MDALQALLRRLGEPVPGLREREIGDDEQCRRPVQPDGGLVVSGAVVARGNAGRVVECSALEVVHGCTLSGSILIENDSQRAGCRPRVAPSSMADRKRSRMRLKK